MPDILSYLRSFRHLIHLPDGDGELLQRFRVKRDELAFATLVQRHGPMVLGIAQRILGQSDLLDDVFQATFLVLAKRGRQMETWPSVAGWLVQVARRTALQARAKSGRRARHEQQAAAMTPTSMTAEPAEVVSQREFSRLLDAELARLPSKYRTPLVLCHLEGQTKEETARQLGWPVGSVSGRLARGKKLLQARLLRRGIVPALATSIFTMPAANAHLPSLLIQATTLLATNVVHQTSQVPTGAAVVLAQGVMTSMFLTKVKYAAAILLVLGLCLGTGAWAWQGKGNESSAQLQVPKTDPKGESILNSIQGLWQIEEILPPKKPNEYMSRLLQRYWRFNLTDLETFHQANDYLRRWHMQINESVSPATIRLEKLTGFIQLKDDKLHVNVELPQDDNNPALRCRAILRRVTDYDRLEGIWRKEERNLVTNELTSAEELIFRKNYYVRRIYNTQIQPGRPGPLSLQYEAQPMKFELHETLQPKGIDWDIRETAILPIGIAGMGGRGGEAEPSPERLLGIYALTDTEFKYAITGIVPFVKTNDRFVPNPKASGAVRAKSWDSLERNPLQVYRRYAVSLKDDGKSNTTAPPVSSGTPGNPSDAAKPVGDSTSPRLLDLRQQRLKVALERMDLILQQETKRNEVIKQQQIKSLPMSNDFLQSKSVIARQVLDARMALTQDKVAQVQAMVEHLKLLQQIEDGYEQLIESTKTNRDSLPPGASSQAKDGQLAARLRRIEFAIQLEELKAKQ